MSRRDIGAAASASAGKLSVGRPFAPTALGATGAASGACAGDVPEGVTPGVAAEILAAAGAGAGLARAGGEMTGATGAEATGTTGVERAGAAGTIEAAALAETSVGEKTVRRLGEVAAERVAAGGGTAVSEAGETTGDESPGTLAFCRAACSSDGGGRLSGGSILKGPRDLRGWGSNARPELVGPCPPRPALAPADIRKRRNKRRDKPRKQTKRFDRV
jgi:hypothetical protein